MFSFRDFGISGGNFCVTKLAQNLALCSRSYLIFEDLKNLPQRSQNEKKKLNASMRSNDIIFEIFYHFLLIKIALQ